MTRARGHRLCRQSMRARLTLVFKRKHSDKQLGLITKARMTDDNN
jgi:hypothetical protein